MADFFRFIRTRNGNNVTISYSWFGSIGSHGGYQLFHGEEKWQIKNAQNAVPQLTAPLCVVGAGLLEAGDDPASVAGSSIDWAYSSVVLFENE